VAESGNKGQNKVKGLINGQSFRSSAMPHGDGTHYIVINRPMRESIQASQGDKVKVTLELDADDRSLTLPLDLLLALRDRLEAEAFFNGLSYSHQKEFITWIESAKKEGTRQARIEKAVQLLADGGVLKGKTNPSL
jgi:uncharacterized protein YdeI (YjbR/CyaY-like superfamily)